MVGTNNMVVIDYEDALTADILISNIVPFEVLPFSQISKFFMKTRGSFRY